jgi:hypothetical protein
MENVLYIFIISQYLTLWADGVHNLVLRGQYECTVGIDNEMEQAMAHVHNPHYEHEGSDVFDSKFQFYKHSAKKFFDPRPFGYLQMDLSSAKNTKNFLKL